MRNTGIDDRIEVIMKAKPLTTSVSVCTYNGERYIADQINSIIHQTVKPDQIVISDDSSTDKTLEIAKSILSASEIDYIIHVNRPGLGITGNFDKSFTLCTGDIVFPCDQDNVWEPALIESFVRYFQANADVMLAFCNGYVTDSGLKRQKVTYTDAQMDVKDKREVLRKALNKTFFPHGHTIAVRRAFIMKCIPSFFFYDCWLTMCSAAEGAVGSLNEKLICFRRHDSAASAAEGGGDRTGKLKFLRSKSFDEFFVWPGCQSEAYGRYLQLYGDRLDADIMAELDSHMAFERELDSLKNLGLLKRESKLFRLHRLEAYGKYRGNRNTYLFDALYLLMRKK